MAYEERRSQPDRGLRVLAQGPAGRHGQNVKVSEHSPGAKGWGRAPRRWELRGPGGETAQGFSAPGSWCWGRGCGQSKTLEGVTCGEEQELFQALTPLGT